MKSGGAIAAEARQNRKKDLEATIQWNITLLNRINYPPISLPHIIVLEIAELWKKQGEASEDMIKKMAEMDHTMNPRLQ